jgi:hypothetical protein
MGTSAAYPTFLHNFLMIEKYKDLERETPFDIKLTVTIATNKSFDKEKILRIEKDKISLKRIK